MLLMAIFKGILDILGDSLFLFLILKCGVLSRTAGAPIEMSVFVANSVCCGGRGLRSSHTASLLFWHRVIWREQ